MREGNNQKDCIFFSRDPSIKKQENFEIVGKINRA